MAKKTILGIDIGYDQLKIALVSNGTVVNTGLAQMPENLLKEGRFTSPEMMASLIQETMKKSGIKATHAAVILPDEHVYVKTVDMPMMSDEQLTYNLPFEFNDYITGEVKDYLFDYAVLEKEETGADDAFNGMGGMGGMDETGETDEEEGFDEDALHLMAVGIEKVIVEDIQGMLRKAGLRMAKTAPTLCSFISLIRAQRESLMQIADEYGILDIGYHSITMYMYKGDQHIATRDFEFGLSSLDDIVADKYGIDRHLAHTYVLSNFENCLAADECVTFYDNIAVELMRAINFYQFSNQGSSLTDIWICGGGAVNESLINMIGETLDADLHPAYVLLPNGANDPQLNSFVQAIGITLEI